MLNLRAVYSRFALTLLAALALSGAACNRDPNYAKQQYLASGNKYFDRARYKEALIMYRKALAKDPKFGEAYYRMSRTYEAMGQNASLVGVLRRATELLPKGSPEWNESALMLGGILVQGAVSQDAAGRNKPLMDEVSQLQAVLDAKAPNSFEDYRLKADLYRAQAARDLTMQDSADLKTNVEQSIFYLRKALQVKPNDVGSSVALGRGLSLYGETTEAERIYRGLIDRDKTNAVPYVELYRIYMAQKRGKEAEDILKRAIANNPKDFSFRTLLAGFYFSQGNRAEMAHVLDDLEANYKEFPQAYLTAGDFYSRIRDLDTSMKQFQEGERKDPGRKQEYRKREIEVLLRQGKTDEAYAKTLEMLKENPKDSDARALKASFMLDRGEVNQAIGELQEVVTANPNNFVARFNLGRAHAAKGEYPQAIQQYQEAIKVRPDYLRPRAALAETDLHIGDYEGALKQAQEIERISPNNADARLLGGTALMRLNRDAEARKVFEDLVAKNAQFPDALLEFGALNAKEKNYAAARDLFHKAYLANPADLRPLLGEAETWVAQNQAAKGLALVQAEVTAHPNRTDLLREYASLKTRSGQYDSAMGDYRALLERVKQSPRETGETEAAIGQLYARKGDLNSAVEWLRKAKALQSSDVPLLNFLAETETRLGQNKEAQEDYRSALAHDPNNPQALNNLAFAIAGTGTDLDEALTLANRAKQQLPQVNEVNDTLGWIYIKKNMGNEASDIFRDLTAKAPDNPTFHYHYCMALSESGDKAGAQRECNAALSKNPDKTEAAGVRQLLAKLQ